MSVKNELAYYGNEELLLRKSNELVAAKFRATDLETDIMNIAMSRIQLERNKNNGRNELIAKLYPSDINRIIKKGKNIYRDLKMASKLLTGHSMVVDTKSGFKAFAIITDANYENNILEIKFHDNLEPHLFELNNGRYATENIAMVTVLKGYAKRLYEILNLHSYKIKKFKGAGVKITYRLSELKFMIGVANVDETPVRKKINAYKSEEDIDWDYLYEHVSNEKMYTDWYKFKTQVLIPAQKEMQQKSNIRFEFEGLREGRPIKKIEFTIYENKPEEKWIEAESDAAKSIEENATSAYRQMRIPRYQFEELYDELVGHNGLVEADIDILLETAGLDEKKVFAAVSAADSVRHINNYMGWLISHIRGDYSEPIEVVEGSAEAAQQINEVKADYDNHKEEIGYSVWEKKKNDEEFKDFLTFLNKNEGLTLEDFELIFPTNKERLAQFIEWKKNN